MRYPLSSKAIELEEHLIRTKVLREELAERIREILRVITSEDECPFTLDGRLDKSFEMFSGQVKGFYREVKDEQLYEPNFEFPILLLDNDVLLMKCEGLGRIISVMDFVKRIKN